MVTPADEATEGGEESTCVGRAVELVSWPLAFAMVIVKVELSEYKRKQA